MGLTSRVRAGLPAAPRRRKEALMTTMHTRGTLATLALAAALGLSGCGTDDGAPPAGMGGMDHTSSSTASAAPGPGPSATFDEADVRFVRLMLPHHEQAVAMSDTLLRKSGLDPRVRALAEQIKAAQQPEIDTMKGWWGAWGQSEPADGEMGGMHAGGADGMASDADLVELDRSDGKAGQKLYLQLMTAHHQGAVRMARAEIADGKDPGAVQLARDVVTAQEREIGVMKDLLASL
jgi:uncharacterized protein (DUF305 family)